MRQRAYLSTRVNFSVNIIPPDLIIHFRIRICILAPVTDQKCFTGENSDQSPKLLPKVRTNFVPIFDRDCRVIPSDKSLKTNPPHHQLRTEVGMNSIGMNSTSTVHSGSTGSTPTHRPLSTARSTMANSNIGPDALIQEHAQASMCSMNDPLTSSSDTGSCGSAKLSATSSRDKLRKYLKTNGSDSLLKASDSMKNRAAGVSPSSASTKKTDPRVLPTTTDSAMIDERGGRQPTRGAILETKCKDAKLARIAGAHAPKTRLPKSSTLEIRAATKPTKSVPFTFRSDTTSQPGQATVSPIAEDASVLHDRTVRRTLSRRPRSLQNTSTTTHAAPRVMITSSCTAGQTRFGQLGHSPSPLARHTQEESVDRDSGIARYSIHVNERFLARVTRPTQASTSKTTEKAHSTPPKKGPPKSISRSDPRGLDKNRMAPGAYRSHQTPKQEKGLRVSYHDPKSASRVANVDKDASGLVDDRYSEIHTLSSADASELIK